MATAEGFERRTACLARGEWTARVTGAFEADGALSPVAAFDAPSGVWLGAFSLYLVRPTGEGSAPALRFEVRARFGGEDSEVIVPETELSRWEAWRGGSLWHLSGRRVKGVELWGRSGGARVPCGVRLAAAPGDAGVPWFSVAGELV